VRSPRFSVVIPSYNHVRFVGEAIRSVLEQDVDDLELIVIDDGSCDGSIEVVRGISDSRMQLIEQGNQGTHAALNRGLAMARGRWLAVLNSDDRWAPGRLRAALEVFEQEPSVALVGSWIELIDEAGGRLSTKHGYDDLDPWPVPDPSVTFKADRNLRSALLLQNYWATTSNFVFPRLAWERHGPFRPLRFAHDWDLALRVQRESPARLLEAPLLQYRVHSNNTIRQDPAAMVYEVCWVLAVHLPAYLATEGFWGPGEERRAEQLLRSVHVYGCDTVLWAMMMNIHHGPAGAEVRLLQTENPARRVFMAEVEKVLAAQQSFPPAPSVWRGRLRQLLRGVRASLRARLQP
jgi:glycosyltransferase involved in cell wall biosynthesis